MGCICSSSFIFPGCWEEVGLFGCSQSFTWRMLRLDLQYPGRLRSALRVSFMAMNQGGMTRFTLWAHKLHQHLIHFSVIVCLCMCCLWNSWWQISGFIHFLFLKHSIMNTYFLGGKHSSVLNEIEWMNEWMNMAPDENVQSTFFLFTLAYP